MSARRAVRAVIAAVAIASAAPAFAQTNNRRASPHGGRSINILSANGADTCTGQSRLTVGPNVDVSNECGPQSETYITVNPRVRRCSPADRTRSSVCRCAATSPPTAARDGAASICRCRRAKGNGIDFGSDPVAGVRLERQRLLQLHRRVFRQRQRDQWHRDGRRAIHRRRPDLPAVHGVLARGRHQSFQRQADDRGRHEPGQPVPRLRVRGVGCGVRRFHRRRRARLRVPPITARRSPSRAIDDPRGPGRAIGAVPFVGPTAKCTPRGTITPRTRSPSIARSTAASTWGTPHVIASKRLPFDIAIPAEFSRGALVYPACDTDRSSGPHRGRLYCSWMDLTRRREHRHLRVLFRRWRHDVVGGRGR